MGGKIILFSSQQFFPFKKKINLGPRSSPASLAATSRHVRPCRSSHSLHSSPSLGMTKKARMDAPLDFLRSLRIKNAIENPMSRTLFRISLPAFAIGLLFLVTGCGEDPRFSARTQYLGGVYGNAEGGPPRDTVSYWD